jgi:hypothetical protein
VHNILANISSFHHCKIQAINIRYAISEFLRLKGDLLLDLYKYNKIEKSNSITEIEKLYLEAIDIAEGQSAKSLELRAAMSLWRVWSSTEKKQQATNVLRRVHNSFTEGFETYDLKKARLLLDCPQTVASIDLN